jgi:hypothetical protein
VNIFAFIQKFVAALTILSVLWLLLVITRLSIGISDNRLHQFLPVDAAITLRMNNDVLVKRVIYDFLFQSDLTKDERKQLTFKGEGVTLPSLGIAASKEIIVFYEDWNKKDLIGWLVHVSDPNSFDSYIFESENIIKARADNFGCILILSKVPENEYEKELFQLYADDILVPNKDRSEGRRYFAHASKSSIVELFFEGDKGGYLQKSGVSVDFHKNELRISGEGRKNPLMDYRATPQYYLIPDTTTDFLEIRAGALPDTLAKYIKGVLQEVGIALPEIVSQQIILEGFELDNFKGSMAVIPRFNGIFRLSGKLDIASIMERLQDMEPTLKVTSSSSFELGKVTFHLKRLSENELFIGVDEFSVIEQRIDERFFLLAGNAAALFTIEGKGFVAQMAQLIPEVKNSKHFLNTLEKFEICATTSTNDRLIIDGVLSFPAENQASLEFLKYIMRF